MSGFISRIGPGAIAHAEAGDDVIADSRSNPSNTPASSLSDAGAAAHEYHARGWALVLVPPNSKGPTTKGWQDLRPRLAEVERHLAAGGNLGVILGPASGSLVDIDLDCGEALMLADIYLPPTEAIFGRASKPRSHRLYIAPGALFEAFSDPLGKDTLVELRTSGNGNGAHQTIMPPSMVDGERREWYGDIVAPPGVVAAVLRTSTAWLAVGCLVARHLSLYAAQRPGPDLPTLLAEADPELGRAARRWLRIPDPERPRPHLKHRRELTPDEIEIAELMAAVPNNCDWDEWNNVGLAIYSATGGTDHGAIVFDDWSAKSTKYNPYFTAERWAHFHRSPPNRTGIGKLIKLALAAGWRPAERGERAVG